MGGGSPVNVFSALVTYLETLTVGQGSLRGERFTLLPWQRRFVRGALSPGVHEAALTCGRGAGKSTLTAALASAALDGPIAEPESEILVVAASLSQAAIVLRHVRRFRLEEIRAKRLRVYTGERRQGVINPSNGVRLELRGANPATLHGAAPSLIIADEIAQWPIGRLPAMLAALSTSLGKIPGSRLLAIGTRPASSGHPFEAMLRDADYAQTHAARPGDPPFQRRTWERACPSLRHPGFAPLLAKIRSEARKAKRDPAALASFRALRLNQGVSDTLEALLVSAERWAAVEGEAEASGPCIWGVDLGSTAAQSAVAGYWPETGRLDVLAAFPAVPSLAERGLRDGVGGLYAECARRGELLTTAGHAVAVPVLLREALVRFGRPVAVASDRWREGELRDALDMAAIPPGALSLRGMGYRDGGEDVRHFRRAVGEGRVVPVVSLLLRAAMAEARTVSDAAGNSKLAKAKEGQRRERARDDAAAAAILAVAEGVRLHRGEGQRESGRLRFAVA